MFSNYKKYLYPIIIITIISLLYLPCFNYPIYRSWDDQTYILNNPRLSLTFKNLIWYFKNPYFCMYHPITMISYTIDYFFSNYNPLSYHIQNVLWFAVSVLGIFYCFRVLNISSSISLLFALIFAVHPQRVESVVWLSERKDVLCAAFYFWSIFFYIKTSKKKKFPLASLFLFILAILSKPMAVSLPFILLIYDFINNKLNKQNKQKYYILIRLTPFIIISLLFVPITYRNQAVSELNPNLIKQVYIIIYNLIWYIWKILIPINLNPIYSRTDIHTSYIFCIIAYLAIFLLFTILFKKKKKDLTYYYIPLIICYTISIAPIVGFVPFGAFDKCDRWSYIPSAFILSIFALYLDKYINKSEIEKLKRKKIVFSFLCIIIIIFSVLTHRYIYHWKTFHTLLLYSSSFSEQNPLTLEALGDQLLDKKKYIETIEIGKKLIEMKKSRNLNNYAQKHSWLAGQYLLCVSYSFAGYNDKAITEFSKMKNYINTPKQMRTEDQYIKLMAAVAKSYFITGDQKSAVKCTNKILHINNLNEFKKNYYKGIKSIYSQKYNDAISYFKKALKIYPNDSTILKLITFAEYKSRSKQTVH